MTRFSLIGAALLSASIATFAPGAERTESGRTLIVPDEHASMGQTYFVHFGKDAQVTFTSDAALEHIKGTSNRVVGYAIAPASGSKAALVAGEFRLPVNSIDTGIPLRDEHLQSGRWMNAVEHPDVVFTLEGTENVSQSSAPDGMEVWTADLVGAMSFRGETRPLTTKAKITLMDESDVTRRRAKGDLLIIRTTFPINLREYGLNDPGMSAGVVAEDVSLDVFLMMSTVSPEAPRE